MKDNDSSLATLRERYYEIVDIFKPDYFKFPLEPSSPPKVIDGKLYTTDGKPIEPPQNVPHQDGKALFDVSVDILKAASISPETVSALTGVDLDMMRRIYTKELEYKDTLGTPLDAQRDILKYHALSYFIGTVAKMLCSSKNFCDYSIVAAVMTADKNLSPEVLPVLTGISRASLDAFLNNPDSLPDEDKYILTFKVLELEKMMQRVRQLAGITPV